MNRHESGISFLRAVTIAIQLPVVGIIYSISSPQTTVRPYPFLDLYDGRFTETYTQSTEDIRE